MTNIFIMIARLEMILADAETEPYSRILDEADAEALRAAIATIKNNIFMNKPCISEGVCHDSAVQMLDNAISRTFAMETFAHWAEHKDYTHVERHILHAVVDELRAMPSISDQPDEWTPILKDLYDGMAEGGNHDRME